MAEVIITTHSDGSSESVAFNPVTDDEAAEIVEAATKTHEKQVKAAESKAKKDAGSGD